MFISHSGFFCEMPIFIFCLFFILNFFLHTECIKILNFYQLCGLQITSPYLWFDLSLFIRSLVLLKILIYSYYLLWLCLSASLKKYLFCGGPHCRAYGLLIPWPGIKPMPSALEAWNFNHWTTKEVPCILFKNLFSTRGHRMSHIIKKF